MRDELARRGPHGENRGGMAAERFARRDVDVADVARHWRRQEIFQQRVLDVVQVDYSSLHD